jgi:hypothetical protein
MKPTLQISDNQKAARSFPFSDYNFQPTAEANSVSAPAERVTKAPAFHELSREIFAVKTTGEYIAEFFVFALIGGIVAWPVIAALHAVTRMVRNY